MPRTWAVGVADLASLWKVLTRPSLRFRLQPAGTWNFTPKWPSLKSCAVALAGGAVGIVISAAAIFCGAFCAAHGSAATDGNTRSAVLRENVVRRPIVLIVASGDRSTNTSNR